MKEIKAMSFGDVKRAIREKAEERERCLRDNICIGCQKKTPLLSREAQCSECKRITDDILKELGF